MPFLLHMIICFFLHHLILHYLTVLIEIAKKLYLILNGLDLYFEIGPERNISRSRISVRDGPAIIEYDVERTREQLHL